MFRSFVSFDEVSQSRLTAFYRNNDSYLRAYSFAVAIMCSGAFFKQCLLRIRSHFMSVPCIDERRISMLTYLNSLDKVKVQQKVLEMKIKNQSLTRYHRLRFPNVGFWIVGTKFLLGHGDVIEIVLHKRGNCTVLYTPVLQFPLFLPTRRHCVLPPFNTLCQFALNLIISIENWNTIATTCEIHHIVVFEGFPTGDSTSLTGHTGETISASGAVSATHLILLMQIRLLSKRVRHVLTQITLNPLRCSMSEEITKKKRVTMKGAHAVLQEEFTESHELQRFPIGGQNAISEIGNISIISHSPSNPTLCLLYFLSQKGKEIIPNRFRNEFKLQRIKENLRMLGSVISPPDAITLQRYSKQQYLGTNNSLPFSRPLLPSMEKLEYGSQSCQEAGQKDDVSSTLNYINTSIGILAASCRLPGGVNDSSEFWDLLKTGRITTSRIPANRIFTRDVLIEGEKYGATLEGGNFITQDVAGFDAAFFNISLSEAEAVDPQQRILLECVQECIEYAGLTDVSDLGVFVGLMEKEYTDLIGSSNSILTMLGSMSSLISGRISYVIGSHGPSMTVDTACSSSLVAVELAINALNKGRCSRAIVAGVNLILSEKGQGVRASGKMLSHHGMSLSFDASASGYGRSDGCTVIVLEKVRPDVEYLAKIVDINVNHGGKSVSLTTPNPAAHKILVKTLLQNCPPSELQYWEAHGTGTRVGDPIELNVLSSILKSIPIGTVKTSVGHGEASAGATALLKLVLMLQNDYIPPLNHFHVLNSHVDIDTLRLPIVGENRELTNCGMTSFGVSGTNAAAIIARAASISPKAVIVRKYCLLTVSAKNKEVLTKMIEELCKFALNSDDNMEDIAGAVNLYKKHYIHRCALIVDRQRREVCRFVSSHSGVVSDEVVVIMSNSAIAYDILQIPLIFHRFITLSEVGLSDNDKLLISFIEFITGLLGNVKFQASSGRELVIALMALSFLPITQPSTDLLELSTLTMFGISPSNNEVVKLLCDQYFLINHYNLLSLTSQLYVNGFELDFSRLFDRPMKCIRIPTYFFDRQNLWFTEKPQVFEHYLLGTIKEKTDTLIAFRNWLDDLRHPQLFGSNCLNTGVVVEIVYAALACLNLSSICIKDLKPQFWSLKKPSWLLTMVKKLQRGYEVYAWINQHDFFSCQISPIKEKFRKLQSSSIGKKFELRPLYIPEYKNSKILISDDLNYATVNCELEKSLFGVIVEISSRLNPGKSIIWFQLFCTPRKMFCKSRNNFDSYNHTASHRHHEINSIAFVKSDSNQPKSPAKTISAQIRREVIAVLDVTQETIRTGFMELGLDSLAVVDLLSRLNEKYFPNLGLSTTDIFDYPSIKELSEYIRQKKAIHISNEKKMLNISGNSVFDQVLDLVIRATQDILPKSVDINQESIHAGFMELGLDSLAVVDLTSRLNEKYFTTMHLSTTDMFDYPSIYKLAEHIWKMNTECNQGNELSDFSQSFSAYFETFELNSYTSRKFVLKSDEEVVPYEQLKKFVPVKTVIRFSSDGRIQPAEFFSSLLFLSHILLSICTEVSVTVSKLPTLANTLARSFFKTLAAEKYPKVQYIYTERLLEVRIPNDVCTKIGGNWLITGGLSGIGLTIARWLADECSAENLVLVSRRIPDDADLMLQIDQLKKRTQVIVISANIADYKTLQVALSKIPFKFTGVIHSAGVLRDSVIERQNLNAFLEVFKPKGEGYHVIDRILEENHHNVDYFIVMSSFTVICGNVGQLNYAVANAYLDHQMYLRQKAGKAGTSIQWGNWRDVGMAKKMQETLTDLGFLGLTNEEALVFMKYVITHKPLKLVAAKLDWNTVLRKRPDIRKDIVMSAVGNLDDSRTNNGIQHFSETNNNASNTDAQQRYPVANIILPRKYHRLTVLETIPTENYSGYMSMENYYTAESHVPCATEAITTNKPSETQLNICNIFGLNIFFDDEDDFHRSVAENIEYFTDYRKSVTEVVSKLKNLRFRKSKRTLGGKSVMLFAGQGAQYPFMGKQLSTMFPIFRKEFDRCLSMADALMEDIPLSSIIDNLTDVTLLHLTKYMQPIIFAYGYACAILWRSLGFEPDFYLGHSVGELVAGVVAGTITLEDGIRLIVERGIAMENIANRGALLAVDSQVKEEVLGKFNVSLAATNSPKQIVIAGRQEELVNVLKYTKEKNIYGAFVSIKYPFHSSLITDDDLKGLRKILRTTTFKQSRVPIVSNVTGKLITIFSEDYLIQHLISSVKLVDCIHTLKSLGVTAWVEAGPSNTVTSFVRRTLGFDTIERHDIMQTASNLGEEAHNLVATALVLEARGVPIRWGCMYQCENEHISLDRPLTLFPQIFNGTITESDCTVLKNHRVNRENVVPGAYQIYLLLKWINFSSNRGEYFTLIDTKFVNYWKLEEGRNFQLTRTSANVFDITVNGRIICTTHVQCTIECSVNSFYRNLATNGLDYRKQFQVIKLLKRSETCTYSILQFEEPYAIWTLMDAALHAVCPSVVYRRPDVYFVPIAVEEIYWNDKIDPCSAQSIITTTNRFIQAHACILVDGELLFHYKNKLSVVLRADLRATRDGRSTQLLEHHCCDEQTIEEESENLWQRMKIGALPKDYQFRDRPPKNSILMDSDITLWDPEFFGISPKEARYIDVVQRLMMNSVLRCMERAAWTSMPKETGVFIGMSGSDFTNRVYNEMKDDTSGYFSTGTSASCVAGRISHWLNTEGPAIVIDTACSSSFTALINALDAIVQGRCVHAIVGGVNVILHDTITQVLKNAGMLSVAGKCQVFDADADGYVRSEAVGCILLSKCQSAAMFKISHWAIGHNGRAASLNVPNGNAQERIMQLVRKTKMDHVECHGTGTALGDPIEVRVVSKCYNGATISSAKALVGHSEAASGIVSLIYSLLQMKHNYRSNQVHFKCPNPKIDFSNLAVPIVGEERTVNRFAINNFGFSGTNCSIVVEKHPAKEACRKYLCKYCLAPISSKSKHSLQMMIDQWKVFVNECDQAIVDICVKLQRVRSSYKYRHCILYNYKRQVVWETGKNVLDSEGCVPTAGADFMLKDTIFQRCWPFNEQFAYNFNSVEALQNTIYYKRTLVIARTVERNLALPVVNVGKTVNLSNLTYYPISDIILFHPYSSSIDDALSLISIWKLLAVEGHFFLIIACQGNGTSYTEWTALCRTLASEHPLQYKFVSYSNLQDLETELSYNDAYECVFYKNSRRYVERLVVTTPKKTSCLAPKHLLITGGTGGIGRMIIRFLSPSKTTVITRSIKDYSHETSEEFAELQYDLVVHCAGAVENALMESMDYSKFESVCKAKCSSLATIFEVVKERSPKKIVIASSVAAVFGSVGQANYAFANGLMTSMAEKSALSTQVIHWGPWENVGMLQGKHFQKVRDQLSSGGWDVLKPSEALMILNSNVTNVVVFRGDFEKITKFQVHLRKYLSEIREKTIHRLEVKQKADVSSLENIITNVSGIDKLDGERDTPLMNLGIDSLMIEKIRTNVNTKFGCSITSKDIYDNCTLDRLSKLLAVHTDTKTETVVGAFSGCESIDELWRNLLNDNFIDAAGVIKDTEIFDYKFWKMTHDDASILDPQLRVFLQNAYHALEKSGYIRERSDLKIGVFAGAEPNEYGDPCEEARGSLRRMFMLNMKDYVSTFTAHMLNLRGPAIGIYSACSTALVAITQACNSLRLSSVDLAIAGGISLVLPGQTDYEIQEGLVLSKSGVCRPFDSEADGTVRGSAVGCVVLKRLDEALRDNDHIEAVIKSFGLSNDGLHKASFMSPNSEGQKECLREAFASLADSDIKRICYVECHGTGTLVGDEIEMAALKSVYGKRSDLSIGSLKANIGHGFAGGGIAGIFKAVKILQEHIIPPQININHLRKDIPFNVNRKRIVLARGSLVAVSSFGIGGTNVHIVMSEAPNRVLSYSPCTALHILPISGLTPTACVAQCRVIANYLKNPIAATLQCRREHFKFRVAFAVTSIEQAVSLLSTISAPTSSTVLDKSNMCFFFAPQGVQYPNMEKASLSHAPVFKKEIERLVDIASELFQIDFMKVMYPEASSCDRISDPKFAQIATFIISRAITAQLDYWEVSSDWLLGHSVGEYAAACYSGILDEYSCMRLLKERGELVSRTNEARLLAISECNVPLPDDIEVTAHLSDNLKCVIGTPSAIETLKIELDKQRVSYRELATRHGFHSSMMDSIREEFLFFARKLPFRKGTKNLVSNVNGAIITEFDYQYCWNHMREPVDLKKCLDTILQDKNVKVIIEIGPSGVVKHLLAERGAEVHVVNTMLSIYLPLHSQLYQSLADLWTLGYDVNFKKFFPSKKFDHNLPVYQFDRLVCWRESITKESARYFKTSWLSNKTKEFFFSVCELCETYSTKPADVSTMDAEELSKFTLIPFLLSQKICSIIVPFKTRLIVISHTGEAAHWTTLGPIRQYHLGRERKNIFVDNSGRVPITQFLPHLLDISEDVLLATSTHLFSMTYADAQYLQKQFELGKTVVVIGGNGAIGHVYVDVLRKINEVKNIVVASRHSKEISASDVTHVTMDICNKISKYGDIGTIIHAAGVATLQSLDKTIPEMLSVIGPKVVGITNIIQYFCQNNLMLDNLLMASSLTSILPLQGTQDYAASNVFIDALALNGHPNIKRVLAVQWPAWRDIGMASTYGKSALQSILSRTSISHHTGRRIIKETLNMSGVVVYASIHPLKMRDIVENMQLMREVASVWSELLCREVSDDTNFFSSGGNSLSALRVVWNLKKLLVMDITVDLLFKYPTLRDFVGMLPAGQRTDEVDFFDNMYLLNQLEPGTHYNIIFSISFRRATSKFCFLKTMYSVHSLIARQHSLRSIFIKNSDSSSPIQVVLSLTECYQNLTYNDAEENFTFNLSEVPLRILSIRMGDSYIILFNHYHIITDGWSMTVLADELKEIYSFYSICEEEKIQPKFYSMSEYAHWQRRNVTFSSELEELKLMLDGREPTVLPQKQPTGPRNFKKLLQIIPEPLVSCIKSLAKIHCTTDFVITLSIFVMCLRKFKRNVQNDSIVIGYPVSGRNEKVRDLIGFFLNNTVISLDIRLQDSLEDIISAVKNKTATTRRFEHVPFHRLVGAMSSIRELNEHPVFQIYFNYRHQLDFPVPDFPDANVEINQLSMNKIFDFSIAFDETPMGTRVMVEYNSGKYHTETIQNFMHSLLHHIRVPHKTPLKVRCLPRDYPASVFSKYLASSRCTGREIAMRRRNAFLTYEALQDQATNIADWVDDSWIKYTGCCIRSDDIITLNAASNDAIVVIMAVLRVGAAYAPIDPGWPQLRRTQVAENITFSLHISKSMLKRPYFNRISEGDLIYVLQTSGSTGSPKGVALSHKNVSCFLQSANSQTLMRPGHRISHSVNVVFDVSVMNIIGSLVNACELLLHDDIRNLPDELKKHKCSFAFLTSAMFNALTKTELHQIAELEKLFVGGEVLYDKNLLEATKFGLDITQIYGPTETTIWSLTNRCKTLAQEGSLVGLPMSNETCWIKHHTFEGELIIGGAKVARGYLNNGVPCYCTGDNVRIQREGFIYRGRIDGEMKVRGHRIESEEVAKIILTYAPQISQVSVAVSNNTLLAFVVHKGFLNESKITLRLKNILPSFMVPSRFISVPRLPLSTSGKVDMDMLLKEHARRLEMMSLTELKVASIFENLLNVQNVVSEDNFFSLGGHSLLLFELKSKLLQSFDVDIEVHELFNKLTVGGLAELLTNKLKENLYKADTSIITELRETVNANFNVYFIHAIGGSIFPYYAFLKVFPKEINLYAIEYKLDFNARTLKELAAFYASAVAAHTKTVRPFLVGHSMGGTIGREMVVEMRLWGWEFLVVVGTIYCHKIFKNLPNNIKGTESAIRLARMLKAHPLTISPTKIYLFKSLEVGDAAFRSIVRPDLTEITSRSMTANGLEQLSTQPVDVWLVMSKILCVTTVVRWQL
ncbi:unnamed protein product [Angiostrongylus costaricensis]|uniref:Fatty acid synthase n=1 Tax=Angiostrongylus costaricensis TaxID=334426 RepID=A0A0R3PL39_ANGCS|nr:unnamed protein product [Angiostrongylus costaricensis]